jgi:hypothetical protein
MAASGENLTEDGGLPGELSGVDRSTTRRRVDFFRRPEELE